MNKIIVSTKICDDITKTYKITYVYKNNNIDLIKTLEVSLKTNVFNLILFINQYNIDYNLVYNKVNKLGKILSRFYFKQLLIDINCPQNIKDKILIINILD